MGLADIYDNLTENPIVVAVALGLWVIICIMLWKWPLWPIKERIIMTVASLPVIFAITYGMSDK